jgi:peptidoglycan/LPS O-acetylase OafA/YrhL
MNNKKKLHDMEILRAMAIIIIVFIHSFNYFNFCFFYQYLIPIYNWITLTGLGLFFFVSGFVLYYNYPKISLKTLENFYYKRIKRIYPLYLLTIILGYGLSFILPFWNKVGFLYVLILILGLQGIFPPWFPYAKTLLWLWFVGVLLVYYLIYPVFTQFRSIIHIFLTALTIFIVILSLNNIFGIIEPLREPLMGPLIDYYWLFFLGIALCWLNENYKSLKFNTNELFSKNNQKKLFLNYIFPILIVILLIFLYSKFNLYHHFDLINVLILVFYVIIIYLAVKIFTYYVTKLYEVFFKSKTFEFIKKISISSYATYLIHPIIFSISLEILLKSQVSEVYISLLMVFIVFPVSFLVGYYLHVWETKSTRKVSRYMAAEPKKS